MTNSYYYERHSLQTYNDGVICKIYATNLLIF